MAQCESGTAPERGGDDPNNQSICGGSRLFMASKDQPARARPAKPPRAPKGDAPEESVVRLQSSSISAGLQARRPGRRDFTPRKQALFFERLAETSNIRASAEYAGVTHQTIWHWRRKDPEFARRWAMALKEGYAALEMELLRQARFGTEDVEVQDALPEGGKRKRLRRDTPGHGRLLLSMHQRGDMPHADPAAGLAHELAPRETIDMLIARVRAAALALLDEDGEAEGNGGRTDSGDGDDDR